MKKEDLKLSPPWFCFLHELTAMFKDDKDVKIVFNDVSDIINVYVEDPAKADALTQILIPEKDFGNVKIKINVIPADKPTDKSTLPLFQAAFKDNPALRYTTEAEQGFFNLSYVVFAPKIVQFFNDDLTDIHGLASMLYEDIALDIFKPDLRVNFCTDIVESEPIACILDRWPY